MILVICIKPFQYTRGEEKANIIHISQDGRETKKEDRVLSIMTKPNCDLYFSMVKTNQDGVKDNWNNCYNGTQVGQWTGITVSQQKLEMGENCTRYVQKVVIDGILQFETVNTAPKEFKSVEVFASRPVWEAQPGIIRDFTIQDGNLGGNYSPGDNYKFQIFVIVIFVLTILVAEFCC